MEEFGDRVFNKKMQEVQQQFLWCREVMDNRFQQLEELLEVATLQFQMMQQMKAKKRGVGCVNTLGWKANVRHERNVQQPGVTSDAFHHLELRFPKFEQVGVSEGLQDCADCEHQGVVFGVGNKTHEWKEELTDVQMKEVIRDPATSKTYIGEPIYDEEPGEGDECFPEEEFILAALRGENPSSPNPLQSQICRTERLEELGEFSKVQHLEQGKSNTNTKYRIIPSQLEDEIDTGLCPYRLEFEDLQYICQQACLLTKEEPGGDGNINIDGISRSVPQDLSVIYIPKPDPLKCISQNTVTQEICVEPSAFDPYILPDYVPLGSIINSTSICTTNARNPLIWSMSNSVLSTVTSLVKDNSPNMYHFSLLNMFTEDNIPSVGNNSSEVNGYSLFLNENGVCKDLGNLPQSSVSTKEVVYDLKPVLIFDPGGYVQNSNSTRVLQDMICLKFLTIEQLMKEHQSRKKVFQVQMMTSARIQGVGDEFERIVGEINQQYTDSLMDGIKVITKYIVMRQGIPEMNRAMRPEYHEASRKSFKIYIFDPGGDLSCLHGVLPSVPTGIQQLVQAILKGMSCTPKKKKSESIGVEALSQVHEDTLEHDIKDSIKSAHHEDMVKFKGEGLSGIVLIQYNSSNTVAGY